MKTPTEYLIINETGTRVRKIGKNSKTAKRRIVAAANRAKRRNNGRN